MSEIIIQNLISPVVLFFLLGIIAATFKSDLQFPKGLTEALSMYLLIAIGIKGGIELSHYHLEAVIGPVIGTIFLGMLIPVIVLMITRLFMKVDLKNSIALAATYGSTSIVTYGAAVSFLEKSGTTYEGFMNAMVVLKESPAILVSLLLLSIIERQQAVPTTLSSKRVGIVSGHQGLIDKEVLKESFFGKSIILLLGSLIIGLVVGERAIPMVQPLFIDLYQSVLILFLLYMGLTVGERLPEVKKHGIKLILFGVLTPILLGALGVLVGTLAGLSVGGATLMGILAGSASYIAAPAALRTSVPEANPSIYLGLSLGVTFPFNLIFGIPLYFEFAKLLH
ncbi:sodium-dependent bicarbonate transport family permease [Halalkalibacterium halodurans]|uniref:BH3869 protein n=2 Tax=Halalkalibacterium halodurans TaxID=86665 RepID=Q9K663_HALH5|nr:sodium-dependent bicarbonate transport family permease [Halalkalibacterium halodurans]MDY7224372.1 sodium-dependent bicarbonate transport family permease [Halalkalibacterium halodurans]MDY7243657.1 sodium-dependent bicarbonate transport family permease [Halalkalibacterium halodurans]MED4079577.1 sodium-dependent bicarbonate transport family permease [Halalkalibacterium halodurans]MED4084146.1 sodium-dependent bicarbonate transport family permease [Halalkalibacterium halodurans]MED4104624.1 